MTAVEILRFALRGLSANKLRSALTTLGILIGVGSSLLINGLTPVPAAVTWFAAACAAGCLAVAGAVVASRGRRGGRRGRGYAA